jgi:hypothetical protein
MKKIAKIFILLSVLFIFTTSANAISSDLDEWGNVLCHDPYSIFLNSPKSLAFRPIDFDIGEDVQRGQEFLRQKTAGYQVEREKIVIETEKIIKKGKKTVKKKVITVKWKESIRPNFLLAVQSINDRIIREVLYTPEGSVTPGFYVVKKSNNGVGSRFVVIFPANMIVLAIKTIVRTKENHYYEVVYTPYSPDIDTLQMRLAGFRYLRERIETANRELSLRNVKAKSANGCVADVVPAKTSFLLAIIEHIDPGRFARLNKARLSVRNLVHEVLVIIGANKHNAYNYAVSPAGARGMFQFMPATYQSLLQKYPESQLNKNFVAGMNDHENAAKASMLLFDSDLADMPEELKNNFQMSPVNTGRLLAAAYNCGASRVKKTYSEQSVAWEKSLPNETQTYLKIYDAVSQLLKK